MTSFLALLEPLLLMSVIVLASVVGLGLVRRSTRFGRHFNENEVTGALFAVVGVVYGALLAFVVFATWESYAGAQQAVTQEAADVVTVYRDTQTFPEPQHTQAQAALRDYVNSVVAKEWESHGNLTMHTTPDLLNPVWAIYRSIPAATAGPGIDLTSANDRLHALENQRHLRHLSGETTLPWPFWPTLLLGGLLVIGFTYFFHHSSLRGQALMTGVTTASLMGVLLLIFALNQPFTGPVPVSTQPFEHALQQFHAIDLGP
jgi:Protein of unknown function (DUF4239)